MIERTLARSHTSIPESPQERNTALIHGVDILIQEGLLADAKKVLRYLQRQNPLDLHARERLQKISEVELQQLLESEDSPSNRNGIALEEPEDIIEALDRDLAMGISGTSLLQEREGMRAFAKELVVDLRDLSNQDRLDVGIGFLEMGLFGMAEEQLNQVREAEFLLADSSSACYLAALSYSAYALILDGRPHEAVGRLQSGLSDARIPHPNKTELLYLMGRANENLGQYREAMGWYQSAENLEPDFRDAKQRVLRLYQRVRREGSS